MLSNVDASDVAQALDAVVDEILARANVSSPPIDALAIASALGMVVALDTRQEARARCVRLKRASHGHAAANAATAEAESLADFRARGEAAAASILLRPEPRYERRQWAVAHEIAEQFAHQLFERLDVDPRATAPAARERVANELAGRLLLPRDWFRCEAKRSDWDLAALKRRFTTASHELIARRILAFEPSVIVTVCDQGRVTFRKSNVAGRVPPMSAIELQSWKQSHGRSTPAQAHDDRWRVNAWPVHEEAWKREILRTEVLTDFDVE